MLRIFLLAILVLSGLNLNAQTYWPVTHLTGMQTIAGNNVTVTPLNSAGSTSYCGVGPYWVGNSTNISGYRYAFSAPVNLFRIVMTAGNIGEVLSIYINGTKYNLTGTNISSYTGSCSAGNFVITSGDVVVTSTSINSQTSANCQLDILSSSGVDSIRVQHMNGVGNGTTYNFAFSGDTTVFLEQPFNDTLLCAGDTLKIKYGVSKKFNSNNVFTAQLSNASGSFASPSTLGTISSDTSGTITWVVPSTITPGSGYRIRMIASSPVRTSYDNGKNIAIGNAKPAKPVANNNGPVCTNDILNLTATTSTSGVNYKWTGPSSFNSTTQNPTISNPAIANGGDYIVTAYLYGCSAKDTTTAVVISGTGTTGVLATTNSPVCIDDTIKLFGAASGSSITYSWSGPNGFTSNQQNPVIPGAGPSTVGDYILLVSKGSCSARDTVTVITKPRPAALNGTSNSPLCTGETINFTASSTSTGVTYAWTGPNGFTSSSVTPFIGGSSGVHNGDYYVTGTLNGCPLKDTVTVLVKPLPVKPVANSNTPLCAGSTLNLTATTSTGGVTWSWVGPNSFASTTQNPNITNTTTGASGDYIVTATLNGCIAKDTATVLVKPLPATVTASSNTPVCAGDSLLISIGTSTTGVTYSWTGPNSFTANTQNTFVANSSTAATGWYIATLNLNGCLYKDSTQATVYPIPATPTLGYNNPLCTGETLSLNASTVAGAVYSWTGIGGFTANTQNTTRSNMQFGDTGTYTVTATANGCTSPAGNISVKINALPFVVIFATPGDTICAGAMAAFTALPNNHGGVPAYQWYKNSIPVGTGSVYSSTTLNNKDIIRCDMRENTKCSAPYTDQSNDIEMNVLQWLAPTVTISANPNKPLNVDEYVTFTATYTNAGLSPKFQWKRNGANVQGATGAVWSANTLNDNDSISVEIISAYKCPLPTTASSNGIRVKVLSGVGEVAGRSKLNVYPNPANEYVVFEHSLFNSTKQITLVIHNIIGQKAGEMQISNTGKTIWDTRTVSPGVYIYRLMVDGHPATTGRISITR